MSDVDLRSATDNELNVIGTGVVTINNVPINTHVCSNLVDNLVSSHTLTNTPFNLWLVFPPKKYGGGALGINDNGDVMVSNDKNYYIKQYNMHIPRLVYKKSFDMINALNNHIHSGITLNDLHMNDCSNVMKNDASNTVYSIHSHIDPTKSTIAESVLRTQQRFFTFSKQSLIDLAKSGAIANFPVSPIHISRYWTENVPHILGTFAKPSVRRFVRPHRGEPGDIVSTDRLGPINPPTLGKNDGIHVFIDYSTLFQIIIFSKSQSSADLASVIERASKKYALYNHKIKLIRQDSLSAAMAQAAEDKADDLSIRQEFRSPHHHEGSDENAIRHLIDSISVSFAGAPHMPRQLWGYAAILSNLLSNLRLEPGGSRMTRMQAFTGSIPDWNRLPIGIFGAPYAVLLDKNSQRDWKFDKHACVAAYLCPDSRGVVDTHYFYRMDTKTVIRRCQYKALSAIPTEWKDSRPDVNINIKYEEPEFALDWQSTHDGSHIFEPVNLSNAMLADNTNNMLSDNTNVNLNLTHILSNNDVSTTARHTEPPLTSPIRSDAGITGTPLPRKADQGDHLYIGSHQRSAAVHGRVASGREGKVSDGSGAGVYAETSASVVSNLLDDFRNEITFTTDVAPSVTHTNDVNMSIPDITGVQSVTPTEVHLDTSTGVPIDTPIGNVFQVNTNNINIHTKYVNCVISHTDGLFELQYKNQNTSKLKLAYGNNNISRVNWITPVRPSLLKHAYDNCNLYNHIINPAVDPSNIILPSVSIPKPTRQERRQIILRINKEKQKIKGKKKRSILYDTDSPTIKQALQSDDRAEWIKAINRELEQMEIEKIWVIVASVPTYYRDKIIPSHIVLLKKRLADGSLDKYKARLVAGGHRQVCEDYSVTSSPTARATSVKLLFSLAAKTNMITRVFDVKGAYLKADIEEEVYMILPKFDPTEPTKYVKLVKNLYGLKTAGAAWNKLLDSKLLQYGCIKCPYDPCVYTYEHNNITLKLCVHVDDLLLVSKDNNIIDEFITFLRHEFTDVNEVTHSKTHLGIYVQHNDDGSITLSQPGYINKIINHCDLTNNKSFPNTPYEMTTNTKPDTTPFDISKYRSIIGLLNHAAIHTRPDILYITSELASKLTNPCVNDYLAAIRVVKYLQATINLGLKFDAHGPVELYAYVDASYNSHADARGHTGICFTIGIDNASFQSISRKHKLVVRSSTESEFLAIDSCVVEVEWLRSMLDFLGYTPTSPTVIFQDNLSTIHIANNESHTMRTKHYNMRYHYIKQAISEHSVVLQYISTDDHTADILTKRLTTSKSFIYLRSKLLNC